MSSESSGTSKREKVIKLNSEYTSVKKCHSSDESNEKQTSRGSGESDKNHMNFPTQPIVTVLEQLNYKRASDDTHYNGNVPKGTATSHNSTAPTVITAVLKDLGDDVIRSSGYEHAGPVALVNGDKSIAVIGGDSIYVQNKTKFIPLPRNKALCNHDDSRSWANLNIRLEEHSPLDVAVLVQKMFIPISSVCFGMLGGVALLQLLLVHNLIGGSTEQDQTFFLQSYSKVAEVIPLTFYVLLTVCIVSVLDRMPVEREASKCQLSWVIVTVYGLTLILSLSCVSYDDMFSLYQQNQTLFHDQMKTQEILTDWKLLNTLRCILAISGWILFSLKNPPDNLLQYLLQIKQYDQKTQPASESLNNSLP